MLVRLVGSAQLTGQVGDGHRPLRAGLEIAQLDLPGDPLVAQDDREMGPLLGRRLELAAELALAELGPDPEARRAE